MVLFDDTVAVFILAHQGVTGFGFHAFNGRRVGGLVGGAVQVFPLTRDLDVGPVHSPA